MLRRPARLKEQRQELSVRASEVVFEPYGDSSSEAYGIDHRDRRAMCRSLRVHL